ncbi:hypothetical protein ACP70R_013227 [Stipagrostis hirtigluma subsp. patula]
MALTICVGVFGPSRAGKSTLVKALIDNEMDLTSDDARGGPTEALQFALAKLYKCSSTTDEPCYRSCGCMVDMERQGCDKLGHEMEQMTLSRRVAFVDCPGHMGYVPTMLKGMMMADGVLILSRPSSTACFSDPPTLEVLAAADVMGRSILVVQSRRDTASASQLENHRAQIRRFTHDMISSEVPILEVSARDMSSIRRVCSHMEKMHVEEPNVFAPALMLIGSSCDPLEQDEEEPTKMCVTICGRVVQGALPAAAELDDDDDGNLVEVRPGVVRPGSDGKPECHPIVLRLAPGVAAAAAGDMVALRASTKIISEQGRSVLRGGLEGHVLGPVGSLPDVYGVLKIEFCPLRKMWDPYTEELRRVPQIEMNQELLLIIGTMSTYGRVRSIDDSSSSDATTSSNSSSKKKTRKTRISIVVGSLSPPTCARLGEKILICGRLDMSWHLIGSGEIMAGRSIKVVQHDN